MIEPTIKWKIRQRSQENKNEDGGVTKLSPEWAAYVDGLLRSSYQRVRGHTGSVRWLVIVYASYGMPQPMSMHEASNYDWAVTYATKAALGQFPPNPHQHDHNYDSVIGHPGSQQPWPFSGVLNGEGEGDES